VPREAHALARFGAQPPRGRALAARQPDDDEGDEDGEIGDGVEREAPALAEYAHEGPVQSRPDHAREVEGRRVERDGTLEIRDAVKVHLERLSCRHVQCVDHALEASEYEHVSRADRPHECKRHKENNLEQIQCLRGEHEITTRDAVRDDAGERRTHERRADARRRQDAERDW
jgi:hypothetical protein